MSDNLLKPDISLKKIWNWSAWSCTLITVIPCAVLYFVLPYSVNLVLGIIGLICLVSMIPVFIWLPYYWKSLSYSIEEDAVRGSKGVFWKKHVTVPYRKITNVDITQGPIARYFGIACVHLQTAGYGGADGSRAELKLEGLREYEKIREEIHNRIKPPGKQEIPAADKPSESHKTSTEEAILAELRFIRREWARNLRFDEEDDDIYTVYPDISPLEGGKFLVILQVDDVLEGRLPNMDCEITASPGLFSVKGSEFKEMQYDIIHDAFEETDGSDGARLMEIISDPQGKSVSRIDVTFRSESNIPFHRIFFLAYKSEKPIRENIKTPAVFTQSEAEKYFTGKFIDFHPAFVQGTY